MTVLSAVGLTYIYSKNTFSEVTALNNVSLDVESGELLGIIGHTGSGKSTLVSHFNGQLRPSAGKVLLEGRDIAESKESLRAVRFAVGLCFQYPEHQLFEETVYKDIAFGPKNMGLNADEIDRRVKRAAEFVGIGDQYMKKSPFDLSGGEKRRVAIAGVMAMEPKVLILDEPTVGLDPSGRDAVLSLIDGYRRTTGKTVVIVSHNMDNIANLASRVVVMSMGKIALSGTVDEVYSQRDSLRAIGLDVPEVTRVFISLREKGLPVSTSVYTPEQGRDEFLRLLSREVPKK